MRSKFNQDENIKVTIHWFLLQFSLSGIYFMKPDHNLFQYPVCSRNRQEKVRFAGNDACRLWCYLRKTSQHRLVDYQT